ncbi:MAG TPA: DUF3800 domain-containing protein [Gemmatimonadales bacterium]|nr:DUF3800 domain-containing protein [Gemmatimonadales bacterium]
MTFLSVFFDASGNADDPSITALFVSGFISTEHKWIRFEREWNTLLREYDIKVFRMSKFYAEYRERRDERDAFLKSAVGIIRRCTRQSFSSGVDLASHRTYAAAYDLHLVEAYPYALAAVKVIAQVGKYFKRRDEGDRTTFVFEDGDLHKGRFITALKSVVPQLTPLFGTKAQFAPLQAGDLLAWHHARLIRDKRVPPGDALALLARQQPKDGTWGIHDADWFQRTCHRWPKRATRP